MTKTIARLRTGQYRGMNFDRDGRRSYRNCDNCLDTELTPAHIFECPAILAALQKIGVLFSSTNLYVDNIEEIARTVIWAQAIIFLKRRLGREVDLPLAFCTQDCGFDPSPWIFMIQKIDSGHVSNTKATDHGSRNFEPWSNDEDDTLAGTPSPNYHIMPTGGIIALTDLMCISPFTRLVFNGTRLELMQRHGVEKGFTPPPPTERVRVLLTLHYKARRWLLAASLMILNLGHVIMNLGRSRHPHSKLPISPMGGH
ncbi:uncharacterized protein TNCV_766871 [Trichonephila clavipes]|nr:uncharacterized protein TNCV_766871 [Trichonephila clavipes]